MIIKLLDIFSAVTLILAIYLCGTKPKIGWIIYIINAFFYSYLMWYNHLIFMMIAGIILGLIGFKNYLLIKHKENTHGKKKRK